MTAIFRNRTVIMVSLLLASFIASFTWVALNMGEDFCSGDATTCVLHTPSKGRMIWDEIAHGWIRSFFL